MREDRGLTDCLDRFPGSRRCYRQTILREQNDLNAERLYEQGILLRLSGSNRVETGKEEEMRERQLQNSLAQSPIRGYERRRWRCSEVAN